VPVVPISRSTGCSRPPLRAIGPAPPAQRPAGSSRHLPRHGLGRDLDVLLLRLARDHGASRVRRTGRRAAPQPGLSVRPRARSRPASSRLRLRRPAGAGTDRCAMVIGADRAGPVAQVRLQLHQGAIPSLLQRLQLDSSACGQTPGRSSPR
jgi:hypothetical protein